MEPKHFPVRSLDRDARTKHLLRPPECGKGGGIGIFLYRFYDADGIPLYIGITSGSALRWNQHRKLSEWWPLATFVAVSRYGTWEEVGAAEKAAIRSEQPRYNKQFRRWPASTTVRLDGTAEEAAVHLHGTAHPGFLAELAVLLAMPERFPQPSPPPLPEFDPEL